MSEGVAVIKYVYEKTMGEAMVFCDRIGRLSGGGRMRRPVQTSRVGFKHDAVAEYEFVFSRAEIIDLARFLEADAHNRLQPLASFIY